MAKVLKCGDLMPGCDTVIHGKDLDEVIGKAEDHARKDHNMTMIPPSILDGIVSHVVDGPDPPRSKWSFWGRK